MDGQPIFSAVSTSARQLSLLLRCISLAPRAEVQITPQGLRFSVEEARVVQGLAFLEKTLFSSFVVNLPSAETVIPSFQISLPALLETLQIFGITEQGSSWKNQNGGLSSSYAAAFNTPALAVGGTCRINYAQVGSPLSITIAEAGVTTTCDITTYELSHGHEDFDITIPLDRNALILKVIMRSTWLHDATSEIQGTNPTVLILNASSTTAPYFAMEGRGGPFGDSTVDFTPTSQTNEGLAPSSVHGKRQPLVTETFQVLAPPGSHGRVRQRYKFDLIRKAGRAMALASKVSLRMDRQGVLSMQFMIEVGETNVGGNRDAASAAGTANGSGIAKVSFVDFRFVPLVDESDNEDDGDDADGESTASE